MNMRNVAVAVIATLGITATITAQEAAPKSSGKPAAKVQVESVTMIGCVAQGVDADHYVLSNAVRREQPRSSPPVTPSKKAPADKNPIGQYDLQGGEFKAHLGHKVEISGTNGSTGETIDTVTSENVTARKPLPTFNVKSVKMLAATCP